MTTDYICKMKNAKPVDDLELFELIVAAYPERFDENADGCIWDEVMDFAEEKFGGIEEVSELLGRVTLLTNPMSSVITSEVSHCLGKVEISKGSVNMTACVRRAVKTQN